MRRGHSEQPHARQLRELLQRKETKPAATDDADSNLSLLITHGMRGRQLPVGSFDFNDKQLSQRRTRAWPNKGMRDSSTIATRPEWISGSASFQSSSCSECG